MLIAYLSSECCFALRVRLPWTLERLYSNLECLELISSTRYYSRLLPLPCKAGRLASAQQMSLTNKKLDCASHTKSNLCTMRLPEVIKVNLDPASFYPVPLRSHMANTLARKLWKSLYSVAMSADLLYLYRPPSFHFSPCPQLPLALIISSQISLRPLIVSWL